MQTSYWEKGDLTYATVTYTLVSYQRLLAVICYVGMYIHYHKLGISIYIGEKIAILTFYITSCYPV